jgi:hypothetical protein
MNDMMDEVLVSDRVWALPCKLIRHHSPLKSFMSALLAEWNGGRLEIGCCPR